MLIFSNRRPKAGALEEGRKLLQDAEDKIFKNSRNYGKSKHADGTISDNTSKKAKASSSKDDFDAAIFEILHDIRESKNQHADQYEANYENQMKQWITFEGKTVENLLEEAAVPYHLYDDAQILLTDLGLPTVISMFCERGKAFNSESFKKDMASMGIKPLVYRKIHNTLMDWKNAASISAKDETPSSMVENLSMN